MRTAKTKRPLAILLCIGILLGILQGCMFKRQGESIKDFGDTVFNVFLSSSKPELQENGKDYVSYWVAASYAITRMYLKKDYRTSAKIVDRLMDTFSRYGCFPRPAYQSYAYGWVCSMDAPPVAVAALMLYDRTGKTKYRDFVLQLKEYMLKDVSEHGFTAEVNGKRWLFEYAEMHTNEENGAFVLNGSMLGTMAVSMLAVYLHDEELQELVEESTENYKEMMDLFLYEDNTWCYYMLNRKTVNQPHYVLFEIRVCEALYELTKDSFYQEQASLRRSMLLQWYKAYVYPDPADGKTYLTMLRGGAPHYYYNDLYATRLDMYDDAGILKKSDVMFGRELDFAVIRTEMPDNVSKVTWTIDRTKEKPLYSVSLGELQVEKGYAVDPSDYILETELNAKADGMIHENGEVVLVKDTGTANVIGQFSRAASGDMETIFVIELENDSDCTCSMNIVLYDSNGLGISRTLLPLQYGKCSAAFSLLGFVQKETALCDVASFNLRIYTNSIPDDTEYALRINHIYAFQNTWEYMQYLEQSDYIPLWRG